MIPLLLFHLRVGVRVALRASPPLFCGIVAAITFQDSPSAAVISIARDAFSPRWAPGSVIPIAAIAFLLSAWGRRRLLEGQYGWIRHLPASGASHWLGLFLALLSVQLPLCVMLALLALTAKRMGIGIAAAAARWLLVSGVAAAANLPLRRRTAIWRRSGILLNWQITRRALGLRIVPGLLLGAACIGASWLLILNNQLTGAAASAAARLGGAAGCALCLSSLSRQIGIRRPLWPLSRSFPWSSRRRVLEDSVFNALCLLPLIALVAFRNPLSAVLVATVVPLMSVRSAEVTRKVPGERASVFAFLGEGLLITVALTLLPWTAAIWIIGTIPALYSAEKFEKKRKATVWLELNHETAGDSASWSE